MSFLFFELLYGALAIGLLVVLGLIVRDLRRRRQPAAPRPTAEPRPKLRVPGLRNLAKRNVEPQPEAPPPAPRKRQLRSLSEVAEEEAGQAPGDAEPAPVPAAPEEDFAQTLLARLEEGFERLQAGEIALETYEAQVLAEQDAVEHHIAALGPDGDQQNVATALEARESVRWCLDWAREQRAPQQAT